MPVKGDYSDRLLAIRGGIPCERNDQCDDGGPCTIDSCDETRHECVHIPDDALCDDKVGCTIDRCHQTTGLCLHIPDDAVCDNGLFCDGQEFCDPLSGCQPASSTPCDDNVTCTIDECNEADNTCTHIPDSQMCNDGLFCNGEEYCDSRLDCRSRPPPCVDNVPCTIDACDESSDSCRNTPDHAGCSNGLFCDGAEYCDPIYGCQPGVPPCVGFALCNEETDECEVITIPTASEWGLLTLALLLLIGGKVGYSRHSRPGGPSIA